MDDNIVRACKKALTLCHYMLNKQDDDFVRRKVKEIEFYMINGEADASVEQARGVSKYIERNFDNVIGQNVVMDIEDLLDSRP
mgnify:CR=1 FL=1